VSKKKKFGYTLQKKATASSKFVNLCILLRANQIRQISFQLDRHLNSSI
jgi:hypothetical protein